MREVAGAAVRVVERGAPGWPTGLDDLRDPPSRLWLAGASAPRAPAVAVVGSRHASLAGLATGHALAAGLAAAGVEVVSGLALGVDGAAHRGALAGGGSTVAVLGCGVDVCYPPRHSRLRDAVVGHGCLVTEEAPGTEPARWRFPRRNRLIAALCCAVVVVEAGERSGALSTARHGLDLGREVLAVPGSPVAAGSRGSNLLLRDGATPVLDAGDVLGTVPALAGLAGSPPPPPLRADVDALPAPARDLLELAASVPVSLDEAAAHLRLDPAATARLAGRLEAQGRLCRSGSGRLVAVPQR